MVRNQQYRSRLGVQFEIDGQPAWRALCADVPIPPLLGHEVDRNAHLSVMGFHTYGAKRTALRAGVTRSFTGHSVGKGMDGVRFVERTRLHGLESKITISWNNLCG